MWSGKKVFAIILAGGSSERFGGDIPKQFLKISGKIVIEHTLDIFEKCELVDEIIVVVNPKYRILVEDSLLKNQYRKVSKILNGGSTRQESTKIGLFSISDNDSFVLIHDAVRPFLFPIIIEKVLEALQSYEAVDVAIPSSDTIVLTDGKDILDIPDRDRLMLGQTPQGFHTKILKEAYRIYEERPVKVTDDCGLVVKYKLGKVGIVTGERFNIKITYPEDIYLAERIYQIRAIESANFRQESLQDLSGKVIVIFGASRGIGKAISETAKKYGAKVYGFSRKTGVDVRNPHKVKWALEYVHNTEGKIDAVINTAAVLKFGPIYQRDYKTILEEINTNLLGSVIITKESVHYLKETRGSILLFASSSYTRGRALYSIYSSTKAAIVNFMQAVADELAPFGCRINAINPERTNTEMRREVFGKEDSSTLLSPDHVAKVSLQVILSNFTGQVIDVRKHSS